MENNNLTGINPVNTFNQSQNNVSVPQQITQVNPPQKKKGGAAKVVALALCCSLVGGAAGAGAMAFAGTFRNEEIEKTSSLNDESTILVGQRDSTVLNMSYVNTDAELTPAQIYAANVNSTVGIRTSISTNYFGYTTTAAAAGSGFILTADGYIVTNYHVVEDANDIKVTTYDNKTYDAKLIGYDESNDIAVLKIDAEDLTPAVLGDSDKLNVGDSVVAIGNPLGELTFSLTTGSVSALNRNITIENKSMNLIQTDCAINSGNSGGALFNSHGEVIGITNAKYSGDSTSASIDNIGFAIPVNSVRNIITSIIEKGYIEKTYVGITLYNMSSDYQTDGETGLTVHSVEEDSPAERAGLKAGDIITAVNGKEMTSYNDLYSLISQGKEGDKMIFTVIRDGETLELKVKLGVKTQSALPENDTETETKRGQEYNYEWPDQSQDKPDGESDYPQWPSDGQSGYPQWPSDGQSGRTHG